MRFLFLFAFHSSTNLVDAWRKFANSASNVMSGRT